MQHPVDVTILNVWFVQENMDAYIGFVDSAGSGVVIDGSVSYHYLLIFTDRISVGGNAIASVRPSVCFHSVPGTD